MQELFYLNLAFNYRVDIFLPVCSSIYCLLCMNDHVILVFMLDSKNCFYNNTHVYEYYVEPLLSTFSSCNSQSESTSIYICHGGIFPPCTVVVL